MQVECSDRGLITYGDSDDLRIRLKRDEAYGLFRGNLTTMSDEYLRNGCIYLSIPSRGNRQTLISAIQKYNRYKRQHMNDEETEEGFNTPFNSSLQNLEGSLIVFIATGTLETNDQIMRHLVFDDDTVHFEPLQQHENGMHRRSLGILRVSKQFYKLSSDFSLAPSLRCQYNKAPTFTTTYQINMDQNNSFNDGYRQLVYAANNSRSQSSRSDGQG